MKKIHIEYPLLLNKKKILLLGKNSTLSKKLFNEINRNNFEVVRCGRNEINFLNSDYKKKLNKILNKNRPDIIVNLIGKFELNNKSNFDIVRLNLLPTWQLIRYFMNKKSKKKN